MSGAAIRGFGCALAAWLLVAAGPALSQVDFPADEAAGAAVERSAPVPTAEPFSAAAARIARAGAALEAAKGAEDRVAALSEAIAAYEAALGVLREGTNAAGEEERAITLELAVRRETISRLLAALQSMSRTPPPVQALHPQGPLGAARAAGMMARLTPALQAEAAALARKLRARDAARRLRRQGIAELGAGLETLDAARAELRAAMAARPGVGGAGTPGEVARMLRDSDTLSSLAAALAESGAQPARPAETGTMALAMPVDGRVLSGFREPDAAGVRRPGILVSAPPLALVTAPADAIVRYAGPFLDYGYVAVLEPRADVLIVLAGIAQLQVRTGDAVERGALLGLLGGRALAAEEFLLLPEMEAGGSLEETLYVEIRHGQGPVDPEPWFAGGNE